MGAERNESPRVSTRPAHSLLCYHALPKNLTVSATMTRNAVLPTPRYRTERQQIGSLKCAVVKSDEAPRAVAVLCHGFGAPGDDLLGLAPDLLEARSGDEPVQLIFPAAPLSLADEGFGDGRAWWRLSIQRLLSVIEQGQYELVREESPPGIDEACSALSSTITQALDSAGLGSDRLLLGGFSQGAMLAMECACCGLDSAPGGLVLYSGCLIRERQWQAAVTKLAQTKIIQSHGELDPILPLRTGLWLRDLLLENGCQVDFMQFQGPHTIAWEAIEATANLLDELAADR
jgi:phospholipase/carboxylesterase